jgi:hypothetical protein
LIFIQLSFRFLGWPSRDDADNIVVLDIYNIEQTPTHGHTNDRFPSFTLNNASINYMQERVEEDLTRCFKGNFVLAEIGRSLSAIPFKPNFMQNVADIHQGKI